MYDFNITGGSRSCYYYVRYVPEAAREPTAERNIIGPRVDAARSGVELHRAPKTKQKKVKKNARDAEQEEEGGAGGTGGGGGKEKKRKKDRSKPRLKTAGPHVRGRKPNSPEIYNTKFHQNIDGTLNRKYVNNFTYL